MTFLNSSAEHFELRAQIIIMAILCVVSYFVFIIAALSPKESVSGSGSNSDAKNQNDFIVLDGDNGGCEKKQISGQTESTTWSLFVHSVLVLVVSYTVYLMF